MTQAYIVHFGELGLKGRNRPTFARRLVDNIRTVLKDIGKVKVRRFHSHILVNVPGDAEPFVIESRLAKVFGISYFASTSIVNLDLDAIGEEALRLADGVITTETTFKVSTSRGNKQFPYKSPEIGRDIGARIVEMTGAPVKLKNPDVTLNIQIYQDAAYLFINRVRGPGGLPVGVSGRVMTLFSGGIDSPVAAHLMLKRGCTLDFLHFHLQPGKETARNTKIVAMARAVLAPHQRAGPLYLVSAAPFETAIMELETRVATVVFRRFIMRVADRIAQRRQALALVTGESVGQVASQTLQNINVIAKATTLPILRPLIGFDKAEIIDVAKHIDTYELSIQPYRDPCSLHARNPSTRARLEQVLDVEEQIDVDALIEKTLQDYVDEVWIDFKD